MSQFFDRSGLRRYWFPFALFVITAVSLYDTWLIARYREVIQSTEQNPVGIYLIQLGHGGIEVFIRTKLAGTVIVVSVLCLLRKTQSRVVIPVTTSVASWQTGLFVYLTSVDTTLLFL
ncbi:MAG: hypothetical protein ACK58L_00035 [Planctomycetota bacterium]